MILTKRQSEQKRQVQTQFNQMTNRPVVYEIVELTKHIGFLAVYDKQL